MKVLFILLLFILPGVRARSTALGDSAEAVRLLRMVQDTLRTMKTISYHSAYRQVNYSVEDSVYVSNGTVWLEKEAADTIFGYRFHIRGDDGSGLFDYYYDGIKSLELRHKEKTITQLDPYADNTFHSPAKCRTALISIPPFLTDADFATHLLEGKPSIDLIADHADQVITLHYPINKDGVVFTKTFFISSETHHIDRAIVEDVWNGTRYKATYALSCFLADKGTIMDSIPLSSALGYTLIDASRKTSSRWVDSLTGTKAKDFTFKSFDGSSVHLKGLKGNYVVLDFWESWCGWCIDAIPKIKDLSTEYHSRGVVFLGITTENTKQIGDILSSNGVPYPTLIGNTQVLKDYHVSGRPLYVLIDPNGKIIAYAPGDLDKIKALLEQRLASSLP